MKSLSLFKLIFFFLLPQVVKSEQNAEENGDLRTKQQLDQLLIPSLFPHVAPYIRFSSSEIKDVLYDIPFIDEFRNETELPYGFTIPDELKSFLQFGKAVARSKPKTFLLQFILNHTGLLKLDRGFEFGQTLAKQILPSPPFASWSQMQFTSVRSRHRYPFLVRNYQKYDHLPGMVLGNKIKQCLTYKAFMKEFGENEAPFFLPCYVLPDELSKFQQHWNQIIGKRSRQLWLLKPPGGSKGSGIELFSHYNELNSMQRRVLAQQYLPSSLGERKFEIRTYVLITSADPLRIYLSYDSVTTLSIQNFSSDPNSSRNPCQHIVNRESCYLGELHRIRKHTATYLRRTFNPAQEKHIKSHIEAIVVKSLLSIRGRMEKTYKKYLFNRYNAFHFVAFDFFVDHTLNVWLNEVNSGPNFKLIYLTQVVAEGSTIAGYQLPPTMGAKPRQLVANYLNDWKVHGPGAQLVEEDDVVFNKKLYEFNRRPHRYIPGGKNSTYLKTMLDNLTSDDVRQLIIAEDELNRVSTRFVRVFPTVRMVDEYMKYFDLESQDSYYYKLYAAWENKYGQNEPKSRNAAIKRLRKLSSSKFHLL